jgi:hypothetical protein
VIALLAVTALIIFVAATDDLIMVDELMESAPGTQLVEAPFWTIKLRGAPTPETSLTVVPLPSSNV